MKKALQLILSTMLLIGLFLADLAVAQDGPQDVTIRDLNTYENLDSYDDISDHPLAEESVRITAVVVSNPKTSGLATYDEENDTIGRIHVFIADTSRLENGWEGNSIQIVQGSGTDAFTAVENWERGEVVTVVGQLTFFGEVGQFVVDEIEETLGNVNNEADELDRFLPLLEPIEASPTDFHIETGPNEVTLDLDAYQDYNGVYIKIAEGTMANYSGDVERPNFTVNKGGAFTPLRDVSLRFRNDTNDNYKTGYNYRRQEEDGDFLRPPIGSAVNVNGFLVINDFEEGYSFADGGGLFIAPMEDGILWIDEDTRLENGVSVNGNFEWPVDIEVIASPPQVLSVDFDPVAEDGVYTPDETVTVSALTAAPEDDPSVTIDSVVVNYTSKSGGSQRFVMDEVGTDDYEFTLPDLVAFESPSLFVEAYGSNDLVGRFPTTGSLSFFVDGGTITEIETIQRTGDDGDGPSPLEGLSGLDFDITATVVSAPADGVIAVQSGKNPWSGIFLAVEGETASLQRGDVVNITAASVEEADIANNSNTYTYLSSISLDVISSGSDLSDVVPVLTTDEFNEPAAPGEAWEGMLVTFENVEMISDEGFGEVLFSTIDADTEELQEGTAVINWDTRAGTIGETGFPDDFNLHARLGNTLDSVTGLVTYTFGVSKIIPRELEDISGENYTVPRIEFNLNSPADGTEVGVTEGSDLVATWQSLNPRDYDFDTVTFEWVLYAEADTSEIVALQADNDGADAQVTIPFEAADGLLESLGVAEGESADVLWNVRAIDATDTLDVAEFIDFDTREGETLYRPLTVTRGEVTSNEEFSDTPRTFELEQNFPNPFNPTTQINYAVPEQTDVRIEVYNVIGRRVATLVNREMAPGNYTVNFDASSLSSGMYFYRLQAGSTLLTKKMTLIK
ncbi:MAG: T9SS type A sorting domain-containing protein [Bacteroidota bacterium]